MSKEILEKVEKEISRLKKEEQLKLLRDLPRILKVPADDILLLKSAEYSLDFWNNPQDSVYDNL